MRKSRKTLVIAVTALVVVAALVGAATALAGVWKQEGKELKEKTTFSLTGFDAVEIESGASVLLCNTTATMTTSGGSTASITAFAVEKASCEGFAGKFKGCTVTAATPQTLPYSVTVGSTTLTAKNFGVTYTLNTGCSITKVETSFAELTLIPEEPSAIQFFHYGQTGTGKVNGTSASITDGGVLQLPEAQWGKYGIG
jgi:hypothetical protein